MTTQPLLYVLLRELPDHADITRLYGAGDHQLDAVARVLASNPHLSDVQDITFIVRSQPSPVIGVMGYFDSAQQARIETLSAQIAHNLHHLRYVDYKQAEQDCERLATQLIEQVHDLEHYRFVGIPRGGLIVLGMLAYALNLSPQQLMPDPKEPLIIVDDCAISGLRFQQVLNLYPNERIIFAPLYSHPDLRARIAQEPRVEACISPQSLYDHAPAFYQEHYEKWRTDWEKRGKGTSYWTGLTEHLCFAWNEPDTSFWNPIIQEEEPGWRIVPDEYCLKNRTHHQSTTQQVQYQPESRGALKPTENVLFGTLGEDVIVANTDSGANMQLTSIAADMWLAIVNHTSLDEAVMYLLDQYDVDAATLKDDLDEFITTMQSQGILTR